MSGAAWPAWRPSLSLPSPSRVLRQVVLACAAGVLGLTTFASRADGDHRRQPTVPLLPAYRDECGACHVAYPAGLLPARSWQHLMKQLPRHYGVDASMEPATAQAISAWLSANAGTHRRVREAPPDDRITRSAWFLRQHDEVGAAVWKRPAVKSPSNCSACHAQAEQGDFHEHRVRIPR